MKSLNCFHFLASLTFASCADWVELPKLQPEDFRSEVNKWGAIVVERNSPSVSYPAAPSATVANVVVGGGDGFGRNENNENKSYTSFEPNIESLLIDVHRSLAEETTKSLPQKILFLRRLQNNILDQMKRRVQNLWAVEKGRGDVSEFPSLEGALMTISVLTFAVFLIKIVSQFIQQLQGANATVMQTTTTPAGRFKRETETSLSSDAAVIKLIEEFKNMHGN